MSKFAGGKSVLAQYKVSASPSAESVSTLNDEAAVIYSPAQPARRAAEESAAFAEPVATRPAQHREPSQEVGAQPDESKPSNIAASEPSARVIEDWAAVSSMHEERARQEELVSTTKAVAKFIRFQEAYRLLRADDKSWTPHVASIKRLSAHVKTGGFAGFWWSCLHSEIKDATPDFVDRDFVLALNFVSLDHTNETHRRMLLTIYRKLAKTRRDDPDPPTVGPMWADLGFQGSDPATDLRSTGIFGLLQVLYLIEYYPVFAGLFFRTAISPLREFPFVLVAFNFSGVVMDVLKERGLHDCIHDRRKEADRHNNATGHAEQEKGVESTVASSADPVTGAISGGCAFGSDQWTPPPVLHATCDLLVGSLFEFYREWSKLSARPITDFGPMKGKLREHIRENVASVLKHCETACDRRAVLALESGPAKCSSAATKKDDSKLEFHEF